MLVRALHSRQLGISMIEVMIAVAIVAILIATAVPSLNNWAHNAQVRTMAESINTGIQLARAEAVRRNTAMRFQLMTTTDSACAVSATSKSWVVSQSDATGKCDIAASDTVDPQIKRVQRGTDGTKNAAVSATAAVLIFDALGRPTTGANRYNVTNPNGGTCVAATGQVRCLDVIVTVGGQVRLCDPARTSTVANPDPQAC